MREDPSESAGSGQVPNRLKLLGSRALVVSVEVKRRGVETPLGVMYGDERNRTVDDLSKCGLDDVETGDVPHSRDQSGGNLRPGQMASGSEAA